MSGENARRAVGRGRDREARRTSRRVPSSAVPIGIVAIIGVLYAIGSLLGWGGSAFTAWAEVAAAAAATGSLLVAARRLNAAQPDGDPPDDSTLEDSRLDFQPGALPPDPTAAESMVDDAGSPARGQGETQWRASWRWYGIAAACWLVGSIGSAISPSSGRSAMSASVFDLFYLAAVIALVIGMVVPTRLPRDARTWLRYAGDTYVCVCALFVLGWVTLFSDLYRRSGETPAEFLLELLYPLVDTVLVCGALSFVLGAARGHRRSAWLGYVALVAFAAADVVSLTVRLRGGAVADDPADILRLGGLLMLALVPWNGPSGSRIRESADEPGRMIGPGLAPAAVAAAATLFVAGRGLAGTDGLEPVVSLVAGSATIVLLVRLAGLLRENDGLRRAVDTGEEHFRALSESINDAVLICDLDAVVQYASAGALRTYRYAPDELLGRPLHEIIHPEDVPHVQDVFSEFLKAEEGTTTADDDPVPDTLRVSCRVRAADGTWLPTESTISRYSGTGEAPGRLLVTTRDLSEQAALQRQVTHLTFHDGLTGLPNRAYFEERTREVLSRKECGGKVAVVFADLDGFTAVNDSAGHAAGDQVLAQAARRLRATVQADDTVARWGGDEFAVLVENPAETQTAVELAERLLRVLSVEPYRVGSKGIVLTASVGIAFVVDQEPGTVSGNALGGTPGTVSGIELDGQRGAGHGAETPGEADGSLNAGRRLRRNAAELIRNGDLAMARAKELGGGRVEVFAPHMHADVVRRLELGSDLQRALAEEEFTVEFQPVVELATSRVTGVEALVRWWRGNDAVPPEEFIGPAEVSGLMIPLGDWVLREACREVARWRRESWEVGLSVNFTARQIAAPRFVESVAAALEETGLPPQALTLEVKEEVLVEDAGQSVERLSALRDLGVRLAIDDFGTGYASLAYLGQLPVDIIKIDPSFVAGLGSDETLTLLTRTIVRLGRDLGLTVVAEGIERPEQLELLREMDCPRGQGFLVARPMAAGRVESLVRTNLGAPDVAGGTTLPLEGTALSPG
ncbi:putative bifunctional diguanylate cyclase/phosphodiesterase [Actinomadura rudentiformis]|uniref:EAL domain-containing protein n=1 Tax=Actinomadura rudentiformis TaxID=359158 RepID=A0A6H9YNV1_9ACTN|nr:EAL domain-containing protein [Actinomadura rudentiformis]KAB2342409.1 EAL domain-containing protein [Actinomadura rudentiformis]